MTKAPESMAATAVRRLRPDPAGRQCSPASAGPRTRSTRASRRRTASAPITTTIDVDDPGGGLQRACRPAPRSTCGSPTTGLPRRRRGDRVPERRPRRSRSPAWTIRPTRSRRRADRRRSSGRRRHRRSRASRVGRGQMSRVLVLGGSGEMGSAAVADLVERTDHEVTVGDIRTEAAATLLRRLGAPERVVRVDVDDPASLAAALADTEVVLNATYMRHNVAGHRRRRSRPASTSSTSARTTRRRSNSSIATRAAEAAGCRIVPGLRRGAGPDQHPRPARRRPARPGRRGSGCTRTSPTRCGRRRASSSPASMPAPAPRSCSRRASWSSGRRSRRRSDSRFPEPYGEQEVHLVPHPEPVTLPRSIDVADVVFKVGYPADETRRIEVLLELGFDRDGAVRARRGRDLATPVRGGIHRQPRHRPDRPERQRQARPRRGHPRRAAGDADLRLRGGGRPAGPRRRRSPGPWPPSPPTWSRAADRPASCRPRPRSIRGRSSPPWPSAT